jgi:Zn-dependent protease with chaperone function
MERTFKLLGLVTAIPLIGLMIGLGIVAYYQSLLNGAVEKNLGAGSAEVIASGQTQLSKVCAKSIEDLADLCDAYGHVHLLELTSAVTLLAGLLLVATIYFGARYAAVSRERLLRVFSPGIKAVLGVLFLIVLAQGAIATYGAYILETTLIHRVHFVVIGGIGVGAIFGAFSMMKAGLAFSRRALTNVLGQAITQEYEPRLWALVNQTAATLGATPPNTIVMGLEPNFYVTSADVVVYPGAIKQPNETMYLSLPLMRILSQEELTGVIGHELGHFRGEDTKFSLGFYPIYAGTSQALLAVAIHRAQNSGSVGLALIPAIAVLSFFIEHFARAERTIGRQRELEADKAGASVASPAALATALLKTDALIPLWGDTRKSLVEALNQGTPHLNASSLYAQLVAASSQPELLNKAGEPASTHPTDTHPPTAVRVEALGLSVEALKESALKIDPSTLSIHLLDHAAELEESLTKIEHDFLLEMGAARMPEKVEEAGLAQHAEEVGAVARGA